MANTDDMELVGKYAAGNADDAFGELVRRHINLVYSVALRRLGNPADAEEVTQAVFIILARKAASLRPGTILPGWLYQTAQLTAANFQRSSIRRQRREQEALMQFVQDSEPDLAWQRLQPLLEEAMSQLGQKERDAIVLRFFENQTVGEVATALAVNEAAAQKRVNRATEKLRRFFFKRGVPISAGVLATAIGANSVQAAPAALATAVTAAAVVKGAAASFSTLTLIQGSLKLMAWTKIKTSIVVGVIVLATAGAGVVAAKYMKAERVARYPSLQGAWEGTIEANGAKLRLVFNIARDQKGYHATLDSVDQGAKGLAATKFIYDYPSLKMELASLGVEFAGTVNSATGEISGNFKQGPGSLPLTLKLTTDPSTVAQLAESDYAPRAGSDLQGFWQGTVQAGKVALRLNLKIAEQPSGTYQALMDSVDQGASGLTVTSITYQRPTMQMEVGSVGGSFQGVVNSSDTKITGTWKQMGTTLPLVFSRADAQAQQTAAGDYNYTGPDDLPGHWRGALEMKGVTLHLLFDVTHLPDDTFACIVTSLDQGGAKIPATSVKYTAPKLRMEWKALAATFIAEMKAGKISGKWRQGDIAVPLVLERTVAQ